MKGKIMNNEEMIDLLFPIRSGLNPSYRQYQKETIVDAANILFNDDNKKFVAVDAPVGSGKSAINVTLGKLAGMGAVYLTPLTVLQDQIMHEEWAGMICVKGRDNYLCSVFGEDDTEHNCNYEGPEDTCRTSKRKRKCKASDLDTIAANIDSINQKFAGNKNLIRMKTSFDSSGEFKTFISKVQKKKDESLSVALASGMSSELFSQSSAVDLLCCDKGARECPVKSSRLRVKYSDIAVLNPDIFHCLSRVSDSDFNNVPMMIIDECQQIESFVGRIFKSKIPIDTLDSMLGIDFESIYHETDEIKLIELLNSMVVNTLGPIVAIGKVLYHLNPLLRVKNFQTLSSIDKNNELINLFVTSCSPFLLEKYKENKKWTFHLIDILHLAFSGREIDSDNEEIGFAAEFTRKVREYFVEKCMSLGCEVKYDGFDSLLLNLLGFVGNKRMLHEVKTLTGRLGEDQDEEEFSVSLLAVYASHLIPITDGILKLVESVHSMNSMRSGETDPYVYLVAKGTDKKKNVCSSFQCISNYFNNPNELNSIERYIEIVPVDTGRIMNYFFYSKAEKVVLSSGTWVMPQGLFKTYGLPSDCDIIKVPSTFPKENRPIYVIQNNNITNFSEKDGPSYVYKTEPGINKFVNEAYHIIKMLRDHILKKHGENSNIIVHCHTFDIAYKIAQYMPEMNERMMVHIPRYSNPIRNIHNGFVTSPMRKNDMVQFLEKNPNSGITLVSCSVSEGVDFKYDTARGQIILKRPTPSIGDPYINVQMKGNAKLQIKSNYNYFNSVVLTTMTQQYGRIVRAKDDYGYTVIMDQSICEMLKNILHPMNKFKRDMMNIDYFIEAMQYTIGKDGYPVFSWFSS